jgi:signal transduction histidine kinase
MYRYWAVGLVVYSAAAFWGVILSSSDLIITDVFSLAGMYIGATLIVDGSKERKLNRERVSIYIVGVVLFFSLLIIGLLLSWPFYFVFTPLGAHIAYVCFISAKRVKDIPEPLGQPKWWLLAGLTIWGISWITFPLVAFIPEYYLWFMVIQAVGVVFTGASMMTLFMRTVTRDLERQYKVTQIMSSLVQHDIRNYIQVARLALELTENMGMVNNHWIDVASESLDGAKNFVDEMRDLAISLSQARISPESVKLLELVNSVKDRVINEYSIEPDQIDVNISEETTVDVCPLAKELLWNIFDNAFKHGSDVLHVIETSAGNPHVILKISDQSGGLDDEIKGFLNDPNSLSEQVPAGLGLGIVLIQGLATMCKSHLHVEDYIEGSTIIGTTYTLNFRVSR